MKSTNLLAPLLLLAAAVPALGGFVQCGPSSIPIGLGAGFVNCPGITPVSGEAVIQYGIVASLEYASNLPAGPYGSLQAILTPQGPAGSLIPPTVIDLPFTGVGSAMASGTVSSFTLLTTAVAAVGGFPVGVSLSYAGSLGPTAVALHLGLATVDTPIGSSQVNPALPSASVGNAWTFTNGQSGWWYDPPFTSAFDYAGLSGTTFTGITLPTGFGTFDVLNGSTLLGSFASGASVDFVALTGGALGSFRVAGIQPLVDAAIPTAFPLQIFFSGATGSFTQTPDVVPEASTLALAGLPLALLWWRQRIKR